MRRSSLVVLALGSVALLAGCFCFRDPAPQAPEECKVTTNPDACRKYFEQR